MGFFSKQKLHLPLMLGSLGLLAMFQAFWLRNVWREQRDFLQKETDNLFQRSVADLQGAMLQRSIVSEKTMGHSDSTVRWSPRNSDLNLPRIKTSEQKVSIRLERADSCNLAFKVPKPSEKIGLETESEALIAFTSDSQMLGNEPIRLDGKHQQVHIFVNTVDSFSKSKGTDFRPNLDPLLVNLRGLPHSSNVTFVLKIDTLERGELHDFYRRSLNAAGIPLAFSLWQNGADSLPRPGRLITRPAFAGLLTSHAYGAYFDDYQRFVFGKMWPHILFSIFLFGTTAAAFALVYRSLRQQQRLTALKNDFIANITHELKTPITTVGVALEALGDFDVLQNPEQAREYIGISKLELERLTLLVDKVLRLGQLDQKDPHIRPETLDLAALVRQVAAALQLQFAQAGARVEVEIPADETFEMRGDPVHLAGVIFNLLDNALKYRREDVPPEIRVSLQKNTESKRLLLRVQDNGIGIAPEHRAKVFGKFYRVPTGDTHNVKGHGLGLNYVQNVVRQHGGNIRVESAPEHGSVFYVEF